ncbi:MAG: hypothetical protein AB1631_03045 [Acidobacteriota bacterium]
MIQNDKELECTQERIDYFCKILSQMRVTEPPENYVVMSSGFLAEIEKMHAEVMEYLSRHPAELEPVEAT